MHEAVGEGGVEDNLPPVIRDELAVRIGAEALRRLHPAIDAQDPEGRQQRARRHDGGCRHVKPGADAVAAEQHDAEEARFEEEGGEHLVADEGAEHRADLVREDRPVGAELVGHHHARDDAHAEGDGEDRLPLLEQGKISLVPPPQPERVQHGQEACEADGEGRKDDMRRDREGELDPREVEGRNVSQHDEPGLGSSYSRCGAVPGSGKPALQQIVRQQCAGAKADAKTRMLHECAAENGERHRRVQPEKS